MYIFISHSSTNAKLAEAICNKIENNGHECFLAPRNIRLGHEYASEIVMGIDNSNAMLLILSKQAINSPHVLREIERAVSKSIPIIVYKYEDVELTKSMEYFLMTHQWITNPTGNYQDVLNCINSLVDSKPSIGPVQTKKPSRRRYLLPLVIALSAILIAGAILIGTFIIKDSHNNNEPPSITDNDETTPSVDNPSTEDSSTEDPSIDTERVQIGDTIVLGFYNDAPIKWRVLKISDDNKSAVLIAQNILTLKGFDAAESGRAGYYEGVSQDTVGSGDLTIDKIAWGDNTWANSSLREWLNSTREVVEYSGQKPSALSFTDTCNSYETEPGFLFDFSEEDLSLILETTISTKGNPLSDSEYIETKDKVFLLSYEELSWFEGSDIPIYAIPTTEAIEKNEDPSYLEQNQSVFKTDTHYWWLRDPVQKASVKVNCVSLDKGKDYLDASFYASVPSIGVRPAITIDLTLGELNIQ